WISLSLRSVLVSLFLSVLVSAVDIAGNPVPLVNEPLVPGVVSPGGPSFTLTVRGSGFVGASVVKWSGSPRVTHFVSSSELRATILAADVAKPATALITVSNPGPGGGISNGVVFDVSSTVSAIGLSGGDV